MTNLLRVLAAVALLVALERAWRAAQRQQGQGRYAELADWDDGLCGMVDEGANYHYDFRPPYHQGPTPIYTSPPST